MTIQVNPTVSPRIITIPEADGTEITVQSLVNQIRAWEDDQVNLCYPSLLSASGKDVLDSETLVGITARLENTKVKFAARASPTDCDIYGGNLVAVDANGLPINPIEYAANVTVTLAKSSSAVLVQAPVIDVIADRVGIPTNTLSSDLDTIISQTSKIRRGIFK